MTSPYIEREAAKLRLVHSAPPRTPKVGAKADYDPRDFRYPRTRREAGIEHLEWEDRLPPPCRSHWLAAFAARNDPPDHFVPPGRRSPQREAGIEHLTWDERITPMRPIWAFVLAAGCWGIFGLAIAWTLSTL